VGDKIDPKPWRVYSSPFWRCLQTIQPTVDALSAAAKGQGNEGGKRIEIEKGAEFGIRVENGIG
jgi:transcription factor C subunit 7